MSWRAIGWLLVGAGALFALPVEAAVPDDNALDVILESFSTDMGGRAAAIRALATNLFWGLVLAEFVVSAALQAVQPGGADIQTFTSFLLKRFLVIGLFVFFFQNGDQLASLIVQSFSAAGIAAGGPPLTPSGLLDRGLQIAADISAETSWFSFDGIAVAIASLLITVIYALLAAAMLIALAEFYLVASAGAILLAFGGASATQDIAVSYFKYAIATGLKLMLMQIIAGIGLSIMDGWMDDLRNNTLEVSAVIGVSIVMFLVAKEVPSIAADMIRGSSMGGGWQQISGAMQSASSSMSRLSSTATAAMTSIASSASAISNAIKGAKQDGNSGVAAVGMAAAAAVGREAMADASRSMRGAQGTMAGGPAGHKASQRINNALRGKVKGPGSL